MDVGTHSTGTFDTDTEGNPEYCIFDHVSNISLP